MHVHEPGDLWQRFIDPTFAAQAPVGLERHGRDLAVRVNGTVFPDSDFASASREFRSRENVRKYGDAMARRFDATSQLAAMDAEGLDAAILYPSRGLFVLGIDGISPELGAAVAGAYNDWLAEFCQASPRMLGAALVSTRDVPSAAAEVRRAVGTLGFKAVYLSPNHIDERRWSDPSFDPLWAACAELGVPVGFHGIGRIEAPLRKFATNFGMSNVLTHPAAIHAAFVDIIGGGVLERFPTLKVAFLEANCSWVPWLLWRLGEYVEAFGSTEFPTLRHTPLEYFRRQCYASIECDEQVAAGLFHAGFEHNIVFSTDYPHSDAKYPQSVDAFLELPFRDADKRRVLWDNCATLYGLEAAS